MKKDDATEVILRFWRHFQDNRESLSKNQLHNFKILLTALKEVSELEREILMRKYFHRSQETNQVREDNVVAKDLKMSATKFSKVKNESLKLLSNHIDVDKLASFSEEVSFETLNYPENEKMELVFCKLTRMEKEILALKLKGNSVKKISNILKIAQAPLYSRIKDINRKAKEIDMSKLVTGMNLNLHPKHLISYKLEVRILKMQIIRNPENINNVEKKRRVEELSRKIIFIMGFIYTWRHDSLMFITLENRYYAGIAIDKTADMLGCSGSNLSQKHADIMKYFVNETFNFELITNDSEHVSFMEMLEGYLNDNQKKEFLELSFLLVQV
ncbi:hypothetical protein [uncultured Vagococcus sp.]|uniref:hypothetical protein n=1 Tax=uncultured Vagococcus sp. TaxID=189676 RepID=UPI0028D5CCB5|nr:hypothetical protein [uncultured Vagococcus sp.]